MKEERFFYVPQAATLTELPEEEAKHAVRVLRLQAGDEIYLTDGAGVFHRAEITLASNKRCAYRITESVNQQKGWDSHIHIAMAPTKMMERTEWFAEKATEIGFDELTVLNCQLSERRQLRLDRIEAKVVGAVKQSRKAWMPLLHDMTAFKTFVASHNPNCAEGVYLIAHCYDDLPKNHLFDILSADRFPRITILIGPEGDFHRDEVSLALSLGYRSVSLGTSRLRTETAALSAVMMANLSQ
ncbi:MAG: 16S rRNA (uracil(1498)-N(3))-methyltransferase [Bacteroidaceae bacterium]|nr:16S rRNA (uracil(1498)-N(3))-methyltransferase [Bacteroidaceae bacterium]